MKGGLALSDAVVIEKCDNYDIENVRERIKEGLQLLGGIEKWVKPGMTVVLKPNLLTRKSPEQAVTTHPHIVQAVAELIQKAGAKAVIVDSPGGPDSKAYLRSVYKTTGMEEVAGKTGAIVSYNPQKVELKFEGGSQFRKFTLLKTIVEADLVINLPKLKTHGLTLISCAVKNLYGTIPGLIKGEYHLNLAEILHFSSFLIDLALCVNPALTIVDAVVGMEGEGPSAGKPKKTGMIFISENPFTLDYLAAATIGLEPEKIATVVESQKRGLCVKSMAEIDFVGTKDNHGTVPYQLPKSIKQIDFTDGLGRRIPKWLLPTIYEWLKPSLKFNSSVCTKCGICKESCPPAAITLDEIKPVVDSEKCIRCYCCQELCPKHAVEISYPWLGRILFRR